MLIAELKNLDYVLTHIVAECEFDDIKYFVKDNLNHNIISKNLKDLEILYQNDSVEKISVDNDSFIKILQEEGCDHFGIEGSFKTSLIHTQRENGDYGLKVVLIYENEGDVPLCLWLLLLKCSRRLTKAAMPSVLSTSTTWRSFRASPRPAARRRLL